MERHVRGRNGAIGREALGITVVLAGSESATDHHETIERLSLCRRATIKVDL